MLLPDQAALPQAGRASICAKMNSTFVEGGDARAAATPSSVLGRSALSV